MDRAYSLLEIKSVDDDARVIEGIASTPSTDRQEDIVEPLGGVFKLPLPFLWQHGKGQPAVGHVVTATATEAGIRVRVQLEKDDQPGPLKDLLDLAWRSIKKRLVRGLSIGFRPLDAEPIKGTFGMRFKSWEWLELSAVTIAANADANILTIKSIQALDKAALGDGHAPQQVRTPGVTGAAVRLELKGSPTAMTIAEQITQFKATRDGKDARMTEIINKAGERGETLNEAESDEYATLETEVKSIDAHLARLSSREESLKKAAVAVNGGSMEEAAASRGGASVISIKENLPPGIGFTRAILCKTAAFLSQGQHSPLEIAKARYPSSESVHQYLKTIVPGGTTISSTWAGPLVDQTNLSSEFIEFLRPMTILGKFGTGNIPSLRRVPFNIRVVGQTTGGNAWWVGQGAPKPLTSFAFEATTLLWAKIATIAVISRELARFSSPSADMIVRDQLAAALRDQLDRDFVDPATAAVTNVSPASITNGLTALSSAGTSADNARTDIQNLLESFILANINPTNLVLIMPNTLALALSLLRNSLGQKEFNDITMNGGTLEGIPVITSQHAANQSGSGNMVIAVNANEIFLADDGQVSVEASTEASLEMLDNPTNNSASGTATSMVSMFQTNSIALLAERFINWSRRRTGAVAYMDDVNWGSIGSPS